jgi:hypothetical protein
MGRTPWTRPLRAVARCRMAEKIKAKSTAAQAFEIVANREGLMGLAVACLQLAMQQAGGNHWHFAEWQGSVEAGSDEFIIYYEPDL